MKHGLAGLALGVLAACTPDPVVVTPAPSFRDQSAQVASQTDVEAVRMAGTWVIRQRFAGLSTGLERLTFSTLPNAALQVSVTLGTCVQDNCEVKEHLILLTPTGPGRWTPVDPPFFWPDGEIWVHWMDFDSRTAAIGTPSGEFGWIMDKNARGGADRIAAARDILDWFGYDLTKLVRDE